MTAVLRALIVVVALCSAASLGARAEDRLALVIGNSKYERTGALKNPEADADLMARTLEDAGFEVMLRKDLDQNLFRDAILEFASKAEGLEEGDDGETIALIFYAGHGVQTQGENYLIPVDAAIEGGRDIRRRAISVNSVVEDLGESNAKLKILILDACRNNPFPAAERAVQRGLAPIKPIDDFIIAFSTDPGNTANDGAGANSPYTEALAGFITRSDLTVYEVFGNTYAFVKDMTNGRQKPSATYQIDGRKLHFAATAAEDAETAQSEAETLTEPPPVESPALLWAKAKERNSVEAYDEVVRLFPESEEAKRAIMMIGLLGDEKAWQEAKVKNSEGGYRIYLGLYPDGIYAAEAQRRIDRLGEVQTALIQPEPAPPGKPAPAGMRDFPGADAYGFDYESGGAASFEDCKIQCGADPRCAAVTFNRAKYVCMRKSNADYVVANAQADAAVVERLAPQVKATSIEVVTRADIPGYDYRDAADVTFFDCLLMCENESICRSFSYTRSNKTCWLKSEAGTVTGKSGVDSGFKR